MESVNVASLYAHVSTVTETVKRGEFNMDNSGLVVKRYFAIDRAARGFWEKKQYF